MNEGHFTALCHPDQTKSCFFCCPPLRPFGYDPLPLAASLKQMLRNNRAMLLAQKRSPGIIELPVRAINGWTCWGLGFLDDEEKKIGCLLHPLEHEGKDLRSVVDYQEKCSRELCLEARQFEELAPGVKGFYLAMSDGMDSFEYSSRTFNPIPGLLMWGKEICTAIAEHEQFRSLTVHDVKSRYTLLLRELSYKRDGYLIERIISKAGVGAIMEIELPHKKCYPSWNREGIVDS